MSPPPPPTMEEPMHDEQKRRAAGYCCYSLLGLFATAAFVCATYSYAYCDFATRYVTLSETYVDIDTACQAAGYDGSLLPVCESLLNVHGVGFEGFWVTVPVNTQFCTPYTQLTPRGWVTPDFDTKFNSARALSITGIILGGAAWFTLMLASCCQLDQSRLNGLSCYFFLATLFQGLSLLIFRSNVCDKGFFTAYLSEEEASEVDFVESVTCGLSTGSRLAIAATVLWFVCNSIVPLSLVPGPLAMPRQPDLGEEPVSAEEEAA